MILLSLLCALPSAQAPPRQVVVILADDMGQMSVGAYNDALGIPTPHLDQLAAEGMRFDDAHSPSAVCTPTRYALLTGRYAWRTRMKRGIVGRWQGALIAEERATLGGLLLDAGWRTDCVGKWHLGMDWRDASGAVTRSGGEVDWTQPILNGPTTRGFERYFGDDVPNWPPYVWIEDERALAVPSGRMAADPSNGVSAGPMTPGWSLEAVLPALAERCAQTIAASAASDQPALLFFSMTSPHTPISPAEEFRGQSGKGPYADFLIETDWAVGEVLRALDEHGLRETTLVIFTADNGTSPKCEFDALEAQGSDLRGPWRGHKADLWEGGHRVPFLVRWPGVVEPGSVSAEPIVLTDILPTVLEAVGLERGRGVAPDGESLVPLLRGEQIDEPLHEMIVHHSISGRFAVRAGRWKLCFDGGSGGWSHPKHAAALEQGLPALQLYDLAADPGETNNLVSTHPEVVADLSARFRALVDAHPSEGEWWRELPWGQPSLR